MDIAHLHFLVADGDPIGRRALASTLRQLGAARITEMPDGHTALRAMQDSFSRPVDLALIDLDLHGMDGLELIRTLAGQDIQVRLIVMGDLAADLMLSIETMAQAYGIELLGTLARPVNGARLSALLGHYTPFKAAPAPAPARSFSFEEIGAGVEAGQFVPYYQPKIELASGKVQGLETFARWRHPEHGVLGPSAFKAALAAQHRLDYLDWEMIEQAVRDSRQFQDQGLPAAISINLAPTTLAHPCFLQQISACVERHRVLPGYLSFELPESAVLSTDPAFLERLVRLRMLGYGLAIDDYGTGRSNLQLLARVPFTELKIDRSFVDGASKRLALSTVLSSCLGLARSLDRKSVAVGVETRQDWDLLQGLGCTYAQGYHIARPMEADRFAGWLADWRQFF